MSHSKAASAARQEFYSTRDIERITGFGYTKAREIMKDFERQRMTVRFGRSIVVRREVFDDWTCAQDGFDKVTGYRTRRTAQPSPICSGRRRVSKARMRISSFRTCARPA